MKESYLNGFGNCFESEAIEGALVKGRNSPQRVPYGLYTEQLSGSAFTSMRHTNLKSWLYRIKPSVLHDEFYPHKHATLHTTPLKGTPTPPTQMRWDPIPFPKAFVNFIDSLITIAGNGDASLQTGAAIHLYSVSQSMEKEFFYNADGEFLIVPQVGKLHFATEFGDLIVQPGEICVMPRGVKYAVRLLEEHARGYICENYASPFRLPELGVIGANGLANPRDFQFPTASYEETDGDFILIAKFQGHLWRTNIDHSPLDVVAWHGNYAPYKYDLNLFNTLSSVSFDHPDPSIFTVLTSPSSTPGVANTDFVIFPPRWMVSENTFRPPYFHRNIMSEYMGLIKGTYDAKPSGFAPGGASLHNCMSPHGPDCDAYEKAISVSLHPEYYADTLAFMFESRHVWQVTEEALHASFRQLEYLKCWQGLKSSFKVQDFF